MTKTFGYFLRGKKKIYICTTITVSLERALKASGKQVLHTGKLHIQSYALLETSDFSLQILSASTCLTYIHSPVALYIPYFSSLKG